MIYKYKNNKNYPNVQFIFECKANSVAEADELYIKSMEEDPKKQQYIALIIEKE